MTGTGKATISGSATLEYGGASAETTTFAKGAAGTLKLDSSGFNGAISGFGVGDGIDLSNISFGAETTLAYSANSDNTGGTLTIGDALHAQSVALLGQYLASSFVLASDGHGATLITDPAPSQQHLLAQPHA